MAGTPGPMQCMTVWRGGAAFEHVADSQQRFVTDARLEGHESQPRQGPTPMELLLGAVAGCTGIDLVNILGTMRIAVRTIHIVSEGERRESHPRAFRRIHLLYEVETDPPDPEKVRRAVELSAGKYCSVAATLVGTAEMGYTLRCHGQEFEGTIPGVGQGTVTE